MAIGSASLLVSAATAPPVLIAIAGTGRFSGRRLWTFALAWALAFVPYTAFAGAAGFALHAAGAGAVVAAGYAYLVWRPEAGECRSR